MANYCKYKGIVIGRRNACHALVASMSSVDDLDIIADIGMDQRCIVKFEGACKWSVDSYCEPVKDLTPFVIPEDLREAV